MLMHELLHLQAPDASRSSLMVGGSQPSTPTSARAGDPAASAAFASPLDVPEAGAGLSCSSNHDTTNCKASCVMS